MTGKNKRKRSAQRSREEILALLSDFRQSGLTRAAFVSERGLNPRTFDNWISKYRSTARKDVAHTNGFCPVTIRKSDGPIVVRLPGGIEIEVSSQIDPQWMIEVVKGLQP